MKICVFGADGRTGVHVVDEALRRGHSVVAFVYREGAIAPRANMEVRVGDVLQYSNVSDAIRGVDAVVSVLGHVPRSDPRMQTKGMQNIVHAMKESGINRILSLTGTGVRALGDTPSIVDRVMNYLVKLVDRERIEDGIAHAEILQSSGLDYTILRVLKLGNNTHAVGEYKLNTTGPAELLTSRKKVAHIMIDLLEKELYIKEMPVVID